ncbi:MFS transporter [Corticicoccus populi]|uniref:MFS transporter n=1 Tax=Corticicoccus populi TaxID=1812821 RepID=A0ABW5WUV2_9STAP
MRHTYGQLKTERNFISLALGRLFKIAGMTLFSIEVIWLTLDLTNQSAFHLSVIAVAQTVPYIIFGVYGGIQADKWNKKRMLIFSDLFAIPLLLVIPMLYFTGLLSFTVLVILTVLFTICNCFSEPSFRSILPSVLPGDKLKQGNALLDSIQRGAAIFVPVTITFFLLFLPEVHIFSVAAASILLALVSHLLIKYEDKRAETKRKQMSDIAEMKYTFSYIKSHPEISVPMFSSALCILVNTGLWRVALPLLLSVQLNAGVSAYSYMIGILGTASLLTSLCLGMVKNYNSQLTFVAGVFIWGTGLLIIGLSPNLILIYAAAILLGTGQAAQGLTRVTIFQEKLPEHLLGKVFSTSGSLSYASDSLSLLLIPLLMTVSPLSALFSTGGILLISFAVTGRYKIKKSEAKPLVNSR